MLCSKEGVDTPLKFMKIQDENPDICHQYESNRNQGPLCDAIGAQRCRASMDLPDW